MLNSLNQYNIYRGPASSQEFNKRNQLLREDIASMYHLLNENKENIEHNMSIVMKENFYLNFKANELEDRLNTLLETIDGVEDDINPSLTRKIYNQNFYIANNIKENNQDRRPKISYEYGVVSPLSTDTLSRFGYITDSNEVFIPNNLEIHLKEGDDTRLDESEQVVMKEVPAGDTSSIVDRNKNTFFTRTVVYPLTEAVHEVFGEIHLIIPTEGFQNIYTNTLKIAPYPEGSMKLHDIMYKGYNDQWSRLSTYPTVDNKPVVLSNLNKILFQFPETEMIELKIKFSQPYWFENNGKTEFTYGFQDINLEYNTYTEKTCEFVTTLDLSEKNLFFKKIMAPVPVPAIGTIQDLEELVNFELYYDENLTQEFMFGSEILSDVNKVYIKVLLNKSNNSVPVLKEIKYPYLYTKK